jgi:hypothetical protein
MRTSPTILLPAAVLLVAAVHGCGDRSAPAVSPTSGGAPVTTAAPDVGGTPGVDDCAPKGGTCVAVSECGPAAGHLVGQAGCGAAHLACCSVGADSCGGRETWACCRDGQESRPVCKDGGLTCLNGAVTGSVGGCAAKK